MRARIGGWSGGALRRGCAQGGEAFLLEAAGGVEVVFRPGVFDFIVVSGAKAKGKRSARRSEYAAKVAYLS